MVAGGLWCGYDGEQWSGVVEERPMKERPGGRATTSAAQLAGQASLLLQLLKVF